MYSSPKNTSETGARPQDTESYRHRKNSQANSELQVGSAANAPGRSTRPTLARGLIPLPPTARSRSGCWHRPGSRSGRPVLILKPPMSAAINVQQHAPARAVVVTACRALRVAWPAPPTPLPAALPSPSCSSNRFGVPPSASREHGEHSD
jgi:hypothetical protein